MDQRDKNQRQMDVGEEDTLSFLVVVVVVVVVVVEVSMLPLRRNGLVQPHKMHTAATFAICIGVSISLVSSHVYLHYTTCFVQQ